MKFPESLRIDMVQASKLPHREFVGFLISEGMRVAKFSAAESDELIQKLDLGETSKAMVAIKLAERARESKQDVFLDFGDAIAEFLPKAFNVPEHEVVPAERFVKFSDLVGKDDGQLVQRCMAALTGREIAQPTLEFYVSFIQSEPGARLTFIRQLIDEVRSAGTKVWFDIDVNTVEFCELLGLNVMPVATKKHSGYSEKSFSATDDLFLRGWYPVEHEQSVRFRWMAESGHLQNPEPDKALSSVEFFIPHLYATDLPSLVCTLDEHTMEVEASQVEGGFLAIAKSTLAQGVYGSTLVLKSLSFGTPAEDKPESTDSRIISLAVSYGTWVFVD